MRRHAIVLAALAFSLGSVPAHAESTLKDLCLQTPVPAECDPPRDVPGQKGLYTGVAGGANYLTNWDLNVGGTPGEVDFDWGWVATAFVGFRHGDGVRTEFELGYRSNEVNQATSFGGPPIAASGTVDTFSTMMNLMYDFDFGIGVVPYVGVGIGAGYVTAEDFSAGGVTGSDDKWAFTYQGIAGLSVPVSDRVDMFVDYRYFATEGLDLKDSVGGTMVSLDDEYRSHTVMAGFRWTFYVPPPLPADPFAMDPVMEEAPAEVLLEPRNFVVFFPFDSSDLTDEARGVVQEAADHIQSGGISRIHVVGHTDTSGSQGYNEGLSRRRAEAVQAELGRLGVEPGTIEAAWRGESEPLVATGDGVREPQNRRAEILFPSADRRTARTGGKEGRRPMGRRPSRFLELMEPASGSGVSRGR